LAASKQGSLEAAKVADEGLPLGGRQLQFSCMLGAVAQNTTYGPLLHW